MKHMKIFTKGMFALATGAFIPLSKSFARTTPKKIGIL